MLETCRGFHHKRAGEFELILPVTSTGQISQCLKCSCLWATSPYFSPCEAIVRAAFSIKFEAGLPWDSLVRLYFVDLCCSLYMIGTTIHFIYILYTFYIHFIYILYFVCLSLSFRIHRRSCSLDDDSGRPGAWWLWPKALGHDAGTTAAAVGGDRLRQPPVQS